MCPRYAISELICITCIHNKFYYCTSNFFFQFIMANAMLHQKSLTPQQRRIQTKQLPIDNRTVCFINSKCKFINTYPILKRLY